MTETRTTNINPVYFVLIAVFLWSTGRLFIKLTTMDAYQVTFFRSLFAAFTVLILTRKDGLKINAFGIFHFDHLCPASLPVCLGYKENNGGKRHRG